MDRKETVTNNDDYCPICVHYARVGWNGDHSPNCPLHHKHLLPLLEKVRKGVIQWGNEGDGVPDYLYDEIRRIGSILDKAKQG